MRPKQPSTRLETATTRKRGAFSVLLMATLLPCVTTSLACMKTVDARPSTGPSLESTRAELRAGKVNNALAAFERALNEGLASPTDVLSSSEFRPLRDDQVTREKLRALLHDHARSWDISMVDELEEGTPLVLDFTVFGQDTGKPVAGVTVDFVHVDINGLYQPSDLDQQKIAWNPRLFGSCVSGEDGRVRVRTIRPAHYHSHYDAPEPAHVHFTIDHEDYRPWGGEIFFDDDPRVDADVRHESARVGTPIAKTVVDEDGVLRATVSVRLQPR